MFRLLRPTLIATAAALAVVCFTARPASATTICMSSLDSSCSSLKTVTQGEAFDMFMLVEDAQDLSSWLLTGELIWDDTLLNLVGVDEGSFLQDNGDCGTATCTDFSFGPGLQDAGSISFLFGSIDSYVQPLQDQGPQTFGAATGTGVLAVMHFQAVGPGTSYLNFIFPGVSCNANVCNADVGDIFSLSSGDGTGLPSPQTQNGSVDITASDVPEPGTMVLLGTGLALAVVRRRRSMR